MEWRCCDGSSQGDVYDVLETEEGQAQAFVARPAKNSVIYGGLVRPPALADA
jgi:putative spermidine/putrescine transport system substrate-binding protein